MVNFLLSNRLGICFNQLDRSKYIPNHLESFQFICLVLKTFLCYLIWEIEVLKRYLASVCVWFSHNTLQKALCFLQNIDNSNTIRRAFTLRLFHTLKLLDFSQCPNHISTLLKYSWRWGLRYIQVGNHY